MIKKIVFLLFFFSFFLNFAYSQNYPYPYLAEDNFYTLETERDYYTYKDLNLNITHEAIILTHYVGFNGNPAFEHILIDNANFLNDSYYKFIEAESENTTKFGNWVFVTDTSYSNRTYIQSNNIGDYVEFEFEGTTITIYYRRNPNGGIINVYINDNFFTTIDTYGTEGRVSTYYYLTQNTTKIKIKFEVSADKNPSSGGNVIGLDGFRVGNSLHLQYFLQQIKLADDKYLTLKAGSISANYLATHFSLSFIHPLIYNLTFYLRVANPTNKAIMLTIGDAGTYSDYITGSAVSTTNKIYCSIPVPPNTNFTTYILNTTSEYCALRTNSTHVGMQRTFRVPTIYSGEMNNIFMIFTNDSGLLLDAFWIGLNSIKPSMRIIDNSNGNDLSLGGYIDCAAIRNSSQGIKVVVSNLIPNTLNWRIHLVGGLSSSYVLSTSLSLTANASGMFETTIYDSSSRLCSEYDYASGFFVVLNNSAAGQQGTKGSLFAFYSPLIYAVPWGWRFESFKIIDLENNKETCVLRPNKLYRIEQNVMNLGNSPIQSGITVQFSFPNVYGLESLGFENPVYLDGYSVLLLKSDTFITLNYNSSSQKYERIIKTPKNWKYDGHISKIIMRITNNTDALFRVRYASTEIPSFCRYVIFSNHYYTGTGVDVILKDLDFGISSNHPFFFSFGEEAPSFNDNVLDIYAEDNEKIVMIYNSSEKYTKIPIIVFYKKFGQALATTQKTIPPGYTFLISDRQTRTIVTTNTGLSRNYFFASMKQTNIFNQTYDTYFYFPANSDWFEITILYQNIPNLDILYTTVAPEVFESMKYLVPENLNIIETAYGRELNRHFFKIITSVGIKTTNTYALDSKIVRNPIMSYSSSLPPTASNGLNPCYPYCFIYTYTNQSYGFTNYHNIIALAFTEGVSEWRKDSWLWSVFTYNLGDLPNVVSRKIKYRFIFGFPEYRENENEILLSKYHYVWRYGYPTSYTKESIDIWFDKKEKLYSTNENIVVNLLVRNYTKLIDTTLNIYVLDANNNIVYSTQKTTNSGLATVTIKLNQPGIYKVLAFSNDNKYTGIGFIWVSAVEQKIYVNDVYKQGDLVEVKINIVDIQTGEKMTGFVNCMVLDPGLQTILQFTPFLTTKKEYYYAFRLSQNSMIGKYEIKCFAETSLGTSQNSAYFYVVPETATEKRISAVLLDVGNRNNSYVFIVTVKDDRNLITTCDNVKIYVVRNNQSFQLETERKNIYYQAETNEIFDYAYAVCSLNNVEYYSNVVSRKDAAVTSFSFTWIDVGLAILVFVFAYLYINSKNIGIKIFSLSMVFLNILMIFLLSQNVPYRETLLYGYGVLLIAVLGYVFVMLLKEIFFKGSGI